MSFQMMILIIAMTAFAHVTKGNVCDKCNIESHNTARVCSTEGKEFRLCEAECNPDIVISCYLSVNEVDGDEENCVCPPCPDNDDPVCAGGVRYRNKCEAVQRGLNWCKINESPDCFCE